MIVPCANCGQKNRVAAGRFGEGPVCGECGERIDDPEAPVTVESGEFDALVAGAGRPVLVDFWAPWCGPCRQVAPEVEEFAARQAGDVLVAKLNTEEHPDVARQQGVQGIPMFALFRDGERVETATGYMSADQLESSFQG